MKTENDNITNLKWQGVSNDIVIQTSNILENAMKYLADAINNNTEYINSGYYEIERHILKTIVEVETKYIDRLTFDRLAFLFGKLVKVEQQLKKHLNMENYEEFKDFYGSIDYDYDAEKPKKAIEPNPLRKSYLKILNGYIIANNKDSETKEDDKNRTDKNIENETWFIVSKAIAKGIVKNLAKDGKSWTYISKKICKEENINKDLSTWLSKSNTNESNKDNDRENYRKNIFARDEVDEEMDLVIAHCIKNKIEINHEKFKEREKLYRVKNNLFDY